MGKNKKKMLGGGLGVISVAFILGGAHFLGGGANAIKAQSRVSEMKSFVHCEARLDGTVVGDDEVCRAYFEDVAVKLKEEPGLAAINGVSIERIRSVHADLNRDKARQGLPLYAELPGAPGK